MKPVRIPSASFCMLALVALLAVLTSTHAAAQSSTSLGQRRRAGSPATFYLLAFAGTLLHGKCLDFGPPPQVAGSPVFIYDCNGTVAQQVRVEEINDRHEVILHAGTKVIGIRNPMIHTLGGAAPGGTAPTEFGLELQKRANPARPDSANQIFALDGDSIILAHSRPCISTDASVCPPPPPQLVVQVQKARGANRSPLVVGPRNLADSEFWDFVAIDNSGNDPTSGFTRVASRQNLLDAISAINQVAKNNGGAAWGSVIKVIDSGTPIDFGAHVFTICAPAAYTCEIDGTVHHILIPTGVTIRGDRRGVNPGPLLTGKEDYNCLQNGPCKEFTIFQIKGDYARITGLRLQGPSGCVLDPLGCLSPLTGDVHAIEVGWKDSELPSANSCAMPVTIMLPQRDGRTEGPLCPEPTGINIDHNEIFDWPAAVVLHDAHDMPTGYFPPCQGQPDLTLNERVHVDRNFIHHNENNGGGGYGIEVDQGATSTMLGNTFLMNRHAIASDGEPENQYIAWGNLVLSTVPLYNGAYAGSTPQQDFDMHGSVHGFGWWAGSAVEILWNTFLGGNRPNFELRGAPCNLSPTSGTFLEPVDYFGSNVTMTSNPIVVTDFSGWSGPLPPLPTVVIFPANPPSQPYVTMSGNQQVQDNPAYRVAVGDFDGDGVSDLFLATGAAWYYAPHGKGEWRYLNSGRTDKIDTLLLGDFDRDGRTDVVGINPSGQLVVSWGGTSEWILFNQNFLPCTSISDMAVGDFDGDGKTDIFCADGSTWWISYGGNTPFVQVIVTSHLRVKDLRFGDFNGDGTTDVFGVVNGNWMVRYGPKGFQGFLGGWQPLPVSLTSTVDGLVVADFDGDGRADVATNTQLLGLTNHWMISIDAAGGWMPYTIVPNTPDCLSPQSTLPLLPGIGRFAGNKGADVLVWGSGNNLCIAPGGNQPGQVGWTAGLSPYSRQDMR